MDGKGHDFALTNQAAALTLFTNVLIFKSIFSKRDRMSFSKLMDKKTTSLLWLYFFTSLFSLGISSIQGLHLTEPKIDHYGFSQKALVGIIVSRQSFNRKGRGRFPYHFHPCLIHFFHGKIGELFYHFLLLVCQSDQNHGFGYPVLVHIQSGNKILKGLLIFKHGSLESIFLPSSR